MPDVAELSVKIGADDSEAQAAFKRMEASVSGLGGVLGSLAGAAVAATAVAGAGLAAGLGLAVKSASDFETTLSGVAAVSGATGEQMEQLAGLALQLGRDTAFSATQSATAIEELVKGGLSIQDVLNGAAAATVNLAAAGGVTMADAANIAANALNEFNLKGSDMAHVSDLIAGAANASAIDVGDFRLSLQAAGAVAATAGFSFDDLAEAIAVMGNAGIKASDAGTSLKTLMLNLQPSTKKAKEEMRDLGIITADGANRFFDAQGKVKSMAEVAGVLSDATKGLTQAQKLQALETIFGSDAIRAAAVLAKEGAAGFDEMAASMGKVTAAQVAATRLDNLAGSLEQLKGSLETAAITVGRALTPALKALVDQATGALNAALPAIQMFAQQISDAIITVGQVFQRDWSPDASINPVVNAIGQLAIVFRDEVLPAAQRFGDWIMTVGLPAVAQLAAQLMALGRDVAPAVGAGLGFIVDHLDTIGPLAAGVAAGFLAFQAATAVVAGLTVAVTALGVALAVATGPVGLISIAVGALTAAWLTNFGDIQGKTAAFVEFVSGLPDQIGGALDAIGATAAAAAQAISDAWTGLPTLLDSANQALVATLNGTWDAIAAGAQAAMDTLGATLQAGWDAATGVVQAALDTIGVAVTTAWEAIFDADTRAALQGLADLTGELWGLVTQLIQAQLDAIGLAVSTAWTGVTTTVGAALQQVVDGVTTQWAAATAATGTQLAAMSADVTTQWTGISTTVSTFLGQILTAVQTQWAAMTAVVGTQLAAMLSAVQQWFGQMVAETSRLAGEMVSALLAQIGGMAAAGAQLAQAAVSGFIGGLNAAVRDIANAAANLVRAAIGAAREAQDSHSPSEEWAALGADAIAGYAIGIDQGVTDVLASIDSLAQQTAATVDASLTGLLDAANGTLDGLSEFEAGLADLFATIVDESAAMADGVSEQVARMAEDMLGQMDDLASDAEDAARDIGQSLASGVADGVQDGASEVSDAISDMVDDALDELDDLLDIGSPSKLMARRFGLPMAQGIASGLDLGASDVARALGDLIPAAGAVRMASGPSMPWVADQPDPASGGSSGQVLGAGLPATGGGGITINIYPSGSILTDDDLVRQIQDGLIRAGIYNATTGIR